MTSAMPIRPAPRPYHVLVVDPSDRTREELASTVAAVGHPVDACARCEDAIASLDIVDYDIVMSALNEPDASAQFSEWMRQRHPSVPIIQVTTDQAGNNVTPLIPDGTVATLHWPLRPEVVAAAVEAAMSERQKEELGLYDTKDAFFAGRSEAEQSAAFDAALDQLYLVYQPVVRARSNCVVGYEALMRTTAAPFSKAGPLLAVANRLGRVRDLDDRVRQLILEEFLDREQWRTFFVNLDIQELTHGVLATRDDPLREYASRVVIEFSQDFAVPLTPPVLSTLDRMREAGYRIAAGNITSTTASLVRMRVLSPDIYKLGAAIVRRCDRNPLKQRYISQVVEMAHGEGALVVAQGIERPEEHQAVVELGCDLTQGFLLGIPRATFD
ncbi:MAG: EAL domain-containing protein [Deltaproteobacteria bacterium]|nr:MAG: EAL domain-containing protein [Deltaproteobacteria bacterium]